MHNQGASLADIDVARSSYDSYLSEMEVEMILEEARLNWQRQILLVNHEAVIREV